MQIEAREFIVEFQREVPIKDKEDILVRLRNPYYLPSLHEVVNTFSFKYGVGNQTDWKCFTIGFIPYTMYECFTQEYVTRLTDYLSERIDTLREVKQAPITVLDPCAGNGRLPYFLSEGLTELIGKGRAEIIAVDNGSSNFKARTDLPIYDVKTMDYKTAIQKYKPDIIIASWIPSSDDQMPRDWLDFFRQSKSIQEYIVISRPYWEDVYDRKTGLFVEDLSYEKEGFRRLDHSDLDKYQLCFEDSDYHKRQSSVSKTVSFIRKYC